MFDRIISIDWSGAATEADAVDLRVAMFDAVDGGCRLVNRRQRNREFRSWSRSACRGWLAERLRSATPTLIACDFGFGFPYGSDQAVFGVDGWRGVIDVIATLYGQCGTARATAEKINSLGRFGGHGPYRFNESRSDFRFYVDHSIGYYRLTELIAPQAISQWYLGSGGTVGFHSITGFAALAELLQLRDSGDIDFEVWPQETRSPTGDRHVIVEGYPSICPPVEDYADCQDGHQRDAWRVLRLLVNARANGSLPSLFNIRMQTCGRVEAVSFDEQIGFEGYIIGLQ